MDIIWTEEAYKNYNQNIDYLLDVWGIPPTLNFINEVDNIIQIISDNPEIGVFDKELGFRKMLVVKQVTLFYKIENNKMVVINIWNNKKEL